MEMPRYTHEEIEATIAGFEGTGVHPVLTEIIKKCASDDFGELANYICEKASKKDLEFMAFILPLLLSGVSEFLDFCNEEPEEE